MSIPVDLGELQKLWSDDWDGFTDAIIDNWSDICQEIILLRNVAQAARDTSTMVREMRNEPNTKLVACHDIDHALYLLDHSGRA